MATAKLLRSVSVLLVLIFSLVTLTPTSNAAPDSGPLGVVLQPITANAQVVSAATGPASPAEPEAPIATCTDSPNGNDGNALTLCVGTNVTLGGDDWGLSVYYTTTTSAGNDWILNGTQATDVLGWMETSLLAYYEQTGLTYGATPHVCGNHIRAKIMRGDGWSGIAWWPNSCYIGLDAPMVRNNNGQHTTMHEVRHKMVQFAYPTCLSDWRPDYPGNTTYIVEGDADYGPSTVDDYGYMTTGYNQSKSLNQHGYNNMFAPYYSEHIDLYTGPWGSPGDPDYLAGGILKHWERCEAMTDLHVMPDVVQAHTPYSGEEFFTNFFAALYLHAYADPVTQPELYFFEEDAPGVSVTYAPSLAGSALLASGSHSWTGETTPDTWAGRTYEIEPLAGCDYVMLEGAGTGKLGWAFMAADTGAPSAEYSGWVGTDFSRVFAGHGAHDKVGASVIAFGNNYDYDLTATCVTPEIEIQRPIDPNFVAFVGDPLSPVAFIAYMTVTDGSGAPVTGIPPAWFELDAEGDPVTTTALYEITKGHYLGVFIPPTKTVGTTTVDLQACLSTSSCDENTDALNYVPPGNMDMVLLHDASGSMAYTDTPGDLTRLDQAKRAAELLVQLAQVGDYYGIMDFSAFDNPPGCAPDCPHDVQVVYPKVEITNPAGQIPLLQAAISGMTAREWTSLGEGLRQAQDMVFGAPTSDNNKAVTILSDGEENVKPMYDDVAPHISVVVNTMGFSGDAPNDLLSRIATENGGDFLYIPTTTGTAMVNSDTDGRREGAIASITSILADEGVEGATSQQIAEVMAPNALYLPDGLALRAAYDYRQGDATGASRLFYSAYTGVGGSGWQTQSAVVSEADNKLALVSSGTEYDSSGNCGWFRDVQVLEPGGTDRDWVPISPPGSPPPNWDVRNSPYHDVVYVSDPMTGTWQIRTMEYEIPCLQTSEGNAPSSTTATPGNFIQTGKIYSTIKVEGQILLENGQGKVGDPVPLLGTVLTRAGASPGALVIAAIERPGGDIHYRLLRDDGASGDGVAADGLHGNTYHQAVIGGAYNVTIGALGADPYAPGQLLYREWKGSFYMEGPGPDDDPDQDRFPTWWERLYPCMDPEKPDEPEFDYDHDDLNNWGEWQNGTNPCDPDTDDGGESDGSEVENQRNPHWPADDMVRPIPTWSLRPLNEGFLIRWSHPFSYTHMIAWVTFPDGNREPFDIGRTGSFTMPAENGDTYGVRLQGSWQAPTGGPIATGGPTEPEEVQPKADPDAPSGSMLINYGADVTTDRDVELNISGTDIPLDGMPSEPSGAVASIWTVGNEISGEVEMQFRNAEDSDWSTWQPMTDTVPWQLPTGCLGATCTVLAQFRDAAENVSLPVADTIFLDWATSLYLPLVVRAGP